MVMASDEANAAVARMAATLARRNCSVPAQASTIDAVGNGVVPGGLTQIASMRSSRHGGVPGVTMASPDATAADAAGVFPANRLALAESSE